MANVWQQQPSDRHVSMISFGQEWDLVFANGTMGRQMDPSWGGPIELFLVPASAPWLV